MSRPLPTLLVIPTGIGCAVGGYAGDGLPAARLLAAASGCLITHPNALNAAALYWSDPRIHYVEGWALNRFAAGDLALAPVASQRVGLLLDAGIEQELRLRHLQVAEACRASLGLSIGPVLSTDVPLEVSLSLGPSGVSSGRIGRPDALIRAGERLRQAGATAIAVVARFPDDPGSEALASYRQGSGVDALAGAEAVISHLLSRQLGLPCAHAPALAPLSLDPRLDPLAAAEELGHTFLPCVLVGLSRAPDLIPLRPVSGPEPLGEAVIHPSRIGAVVAPAGALGGEAVLACAERGIPLIAVEGNPSLLEVSAGRLGLSAIAAASYAEAAGLVLALREGLQPEALRRPLPPLEQLSADRPSDGGSASPGPWPLRDGTRPHPPC
ncbi:MULTISPECIES: DUF3326 domain-containing protein [unclassified Synechococcus]|uniref:DUF3326 domain-containing protein n=1 Tax=unclassified Synechococcus TaxID=2626047 RepID=UPI0000699398|nr:MULTISPECIES: DUF3326 domain-containing protein [unclassified Synechococcus]EAQ76168.1 hypothetical protein WH5701_15216 [Synechococcus sp. WH 5701]WFN58874.1 DUF3326 domain-containing protein [Synechococcus sp. CCFWC 502]